MIRIYKKYFLSLSTKYWKNGRSYVNNSQDLAKTLKMLEEALEEENNSEL